MRRKSLCIHERPDWPRFRWDSVQLTSALSACRHQQGRLLGQMEALGFPLQQEAVLQTLTDDVVKSSEIEGETLDVQQVRSSVARRLGLDVGGIVVADRHVEGVVVAIHPFDDGNGRLARAIGDLALARSERSAQRFYSMSSQIRQERAAYYDILERPQRGTLDVTPWMEWFLACLNRAIDGAQTTLAAVLAKARFWQTLGTAPIHERQRLMLNRLLENFEGHLTTSKWATIAECSSDSALRDILDDGTGHTRPQPWKGPQHQLLAC